MANLKKYISYIRVSTQKQGQSGLGLIAQQDIIKKYINGNSILLNEYVEIESGKKSNRPQLQQAIEQCKNTGATLIIAKLDRLSRNVAFVSNLNQSGIEFICCDNPNANKLTINILASIAEYEAELISTRTKQALQVLKNQGIKLGKNNMTPTIQQMGIEQIKAKSKQNPNNIKSISFAKSLRNNGKKYSEILMELNQNGYKTSTGKAFINVSQVTRLLK